MNRSLGMSPFKVVHDFKLRKLLDLIPISPHARVSMSTETFAQHLHES